jgi:phosphocarrier protein
MQQREVEIVNKPGLDAPASGKLTQLAARYQCEVSLMRRGRKVNAKSLMGVMMLAAGQGSRVVLETEGPDEIEALDAIAALLGSDFAEAE